MRSRRGQPEQHVAGLDALAGQLPTALDRADREARKVIVAVRVHAGHLGGLAADQRAAGDPATIGDARDDRRRDAGVELAGAKIVEEEQRLGPLHDQVVDAHRDQIDANGVVDI
jgi:hypothetical protein